MNIDEESLILLNNLIYLNDLEEKKTVAENVSKFLNNDSIAFKVKEKYLANLSTDEWLQILLRIKSRKNAYSLKILDITTEDNEGFKAMTLYSEETNDTIVIFQETTTDSEWDDNVSGLFTIMSSNEKKALDYIENKVNDEKIIVTGHSKGGNLAQFVCLKSDKIKKCLSFNGQGFSNQFIKSNVNNKDFIERQKKIISFRSSRDIVGELLFPVALTENTKFFDSKYNYSNQFSFHKPNEPIINLNVFENGYLKNSTKAVKSIKIIGDLSRRLSNSNIYASAFWSFFFVKIRFQKLTDKPEWNFKMIAKIVHENRNNTDNNKKSMLDIIVTGFDIFISLFYFFIVWYMERFKYSFKRASK